MRRNALQTELRAAEHDRQAVPVVSNADPGALALSAYAGSLGVKIDPATLGLWLSLVGVLALELGAAFSVVLVRAVNGTQVAHVAHAQITGDATAHETSKPIKIRKQKPRRRDNDDDCGPRKRRLAGLRDAMQANGGVINLSQRKLARKLGASRTTLQRALNDLAAAGDVMLDTSRSGTRLLAP